jgi:hypothetical protein
MSSPSLTYGALVALIFVGAMEFAADPTQAAMLIQPAGMNPSQAQLVYGGCGAGWRRTVFGGCTRVNQPRFTCQPGFHKVPAPTPSGHRCVMNGY